MRIELLEKGDKVLNVSEGRIVIRRKGGEVDIIYYEETEDGIQVLDKGVTIGFKSRIEKEIVDGVEITTF